MFPSPRPLIYFVGRLTIVSGVACACALPLPAWGQEPAAAPEEAASPPPPAAAPAPATPAPALLERLDEVDQRARIVERKLELADEAAAARRKEAALFTADENGFGISSADKQYQIRLRGQLQFDGRRFFGDASLDDRDTFLLRRIRPTLSGTLLGLADFVFTPDFGGGTTVIVAAYIDIHPRPWLRLRAGKFKPPLGLERLQADQDLPLIERALDSNLTAQREVGLQLWGEIAGGIIRYDAGVYNGVPDGTLLDNDTDYAKTFAGRILLQPFAAEGLRALGRLGIGVAASSGNEKGSSALTAGAASNTWLPTFRSAGQNTIYAYLSSTTDTNATVFAQRRHARVNPQLYYYFGPLGLLAEWVHEYQALGKGNDTGAVNHSAGHVTVSFVLGGDESYEGARARRPLDLATGSLGALELAARYNWIDFDDVGFPALADPTKSVTSARGFAAGANWVISRNIKAMGDYEQTSFKGGVKGGDRKIEKVVIGRLQVAF